MPCFRGSSRPSAGLVFSFRHPAIAESRNRFPRAARGVRQKHMHNRQNFSEIIFNNYFTSA